MIEREILQTLQKATTAAVAQSSMVGLPIKFTGITFVVPNDQKYLEVVHIPNNADRQYYGDEKQYQGLFRIILHWPIDAQGVYPAMNLIASIAGYFSKNRWFDKVKISEVPNLTGVLEKPPEVLLPVSIRYVAFEA